MGTSSDKLLFLQGTKSAIKDAIVAKGISVPVGTAFREYATKIGQIETAEYQGGDVAEVWVRPTEWLALPNNVDGVQKVSILNAVFNTDSEFVALICSGAYTVNWGDGVVENFADNVKAEHKYTYSDVALNSATVATFGYKQCIITITPQAGQSLSSINLNAHHSTVGNSTSYDLASGFLDIRINSLSCIDLLIGTNASYVKHTMLEQCLIGELNDPTLERLFYDCYSLQSVAIKDTSNVISFASMHYNNHSLQKMPTYTFRSAGVDTNSMYSNCHSLIETYPMTINISSSTSITSMFTSCKSLRYVDLTINSSINYSLSTLFSGCLSLDSIKLTLLGSGKVDNLTDTFGYTRIKSSPAIDTSLCTSFNTTFNYCEKLTNLYTYNYASATTLYSMLNNCSSIKQVGNFNTTVSCTNLSAICQNCNSLEKAPTFSDSSGVTNIQSMLSNCKSLTIIPSYVFGTLSSTGLGSLMSGCDSLQIMPSITVGSSYTSNTSAFYNNYSLKRMLMPLRFTFSVANAKMSSTALNEMYSILPTITSQTVTVTGNYGVSGDDPTIATSRGWTVVG